MIVGLLLFTLKVLGTESLYPLEDTLPLSEDESLPSILNITETVKTHCLSRTDSSGANSSVF